MSGHFATVLAATLSRQFAVSKRRLATLGALVSGCLASRTVNLSHIAGLVPGRARIGSRYRRLQRFFQWVQLDDGAVARTVVSLLGLRPPFTLCLDRTNWQAGHTDINILVLAIAGRKARIPLLWTMLDGCGGSETAERIRLISRFCELFGKEAIAVLVADREFVGAQWFDFLVEADIPFVIRLKQNQTVMLASGGRTNVATLFSRRLWRRRETCSGLHLEGMRPQAAEHLALAAKTIQNNARLVVLTNRDPRRATGTYRRRWQIECLFAETKTRGLNLEDTHMTDPRKLATLLAVVALAIACAQLAARTIQGRIGIKRAPHGYRRKSTFRTGFDALRAWIHLQSDELRTLCLRADKALKTQRVV
jgi:hypothetical protein